MSKPRHPHHAPARPGSEATAVGSLRWPQSWAGLGGADVSVEQATDLVWVLTSFDMFDRSVPAVVAVSRRSPSIWSMAERSLCR